MTEELIQFPCEFPIKAMGLAADKIEDIVFMIVSKHAPNFSHDAMHTVPSKNGKYDSVTATIYATSRQQLDNIYQDLTDHPQIMMAL